MRSLVTALVLVLCSTAKAEDYYFPATGNFQPVNPFVTSEGNPVYIWGVTNLYNGVQCTEAVKFDGVDQFGHPFTKDSQYPGASNVARTCSIAAAISMPNTSDGMTVRVFGRHPSGIFLFGDTKTQNDSCSIFAQTKFGANFWSASASSVNKYSEQGKNYELVFTAVPKAVLDNAPYLTLVCQMVKDQVIYGYRVTFDWAL